MRVKIKKTPYILDRGYAKFLVNYEELVFVESNFKRTKKVLKEAKLLIFGIVLLVLSICISKNNRILDLVNSFFIGVAITAIAFNLKEEFKD